MDNGLSRVLTAKETLSLSFGAMIGWGWIVLAGGWLSSAGTLGAALALLIGGGMVTLIACTYAELAAAMPKVGGEHVYSHRALGNIGSFVCTWAIILGYVSVSAFEAVALPTVLAYLMPDYQKIYLWTVAGWDVHLTWVLVGSVGAVIVCIVNILGIRSSAFLQSVLVCLLIAGGLLLMSGAMVGGSVTNMTPLFQGGMGGISAVIVMVPFILVGFDVIPQAAEEINLPPRYIGRLLIFSLLLAVSWYVLVALSVGYSLGPEQRDSTELVTAEAASAAWSGEWAGIFMVLAGVGGIITSWNAFVVGGSRAIYAMAKSNQLPAFLGRLHPRYHTPINAIILIGIISVLTPLFGRMALIWLVNAGGLGIVVAYMFVTISFLVLRHREPEMPRPYRLPYGTLVGWLALFAAFGMILLYLPGSPSALVWPWEWGICIGWCILGVLLYWCARRERDYNLLEKNQPD